MARKWATDQARLRYRLQKLNSKHTGPLSGEAGGAQLDPMWLMIFPEGNESQRQHSERVCQVLPKIRHPRHEAPSCFLEVPASSSACKSFATLYRMCTIVRLHMVAFLQVPTVKTFSLSVPSISKAGRHHRSTCTGGDSAVKDIPIDDADAMHDWVLQRWREKDEMLDAFMKTGAFPTADPEALSFEIEGVPKGKACIDTEVRPRTSSGVSADVHTRCRRGVGRQDMCTGAG